MLGSISPFGERARRQRWGVTFAAYVTGSVVAGGAFGALVGAAGGRALDGTRLQGVPSIWILLGVVVLGLALDLRVLGFGLPTTHRQVDEDWLHRYRGWVYGLGFGFQLGLGVVTIVSTSTVYATFAAAALSGSPTSGMVVGGAFGLVRGAGLLAVGRVRSVEQLHRIDGALRRWEGPARRGALVSVAALTVAALAMAVTLR